MSAIAIFQQLSQAGQDCDAGEEQAQASECETPSPPWSWAVRKNLLLELAELHVGRQSPEQWLELLVRWQSIIHFKLKFPTLIVGEEQADHSSSH
jgi:hypothetical protein